MPQQTRPKPYSRITPQSASISKSARSHSSGAHNNQIGPQSSMSQPSEPLPHQVPGSRIQMMLNRSRGTTVPSPGEGPDYSQCDSTKSNVDDDDLGHFNFESNHNDDLNMQINNALEEQAALDLVQSSGSSTDAAESPTTPSTHLTGARLQMFNRLATRANLDDQSQTLGRFMCNFEAGGDQFLACMVTILAVHQDVSSVRDELLEAIRKNPTPQASSPSIAITWKGDTAELKQCMRLLGTQCILGGELQAYTARVDPIGGTDQLPLSLYARVMGAMLSHPSEWKNRVLPPGYGTNPDPRHTRSLESTLNNVLKEVRKSFDDVLLTHINLPNRVGSSSNANVPVLDTVIVKLYQKERGLIGGRVRVREEILQEVDQMQTSRYAWLRMQAIHWGLNFAEYEGRSFWNIVDRQLAFLRSQSARYRYAFSLLVLQSDLERIDGTKTFEELKEITDFALPTETQIQDAMNELNMTFGEEVQPDERAYAALPDEAT